MQKGEPPASHTRVDLLGMPVSPLRQAEAVQQVLDWIRLGDGTLRFVVTPNVQHSLLYQRDEAFRRAYASASLVLVDGTPLVWVSRWLGASLPERVAGSDLVPAVLGAASSVQPISVFLLGAAPGIAEHAARLIEARFAHVRIAGTYSPPLGFENDDQENAHIVALVNDARPDLLVLGLGSPKQELWIQRFRSEIRAGVALCAGAAIDFIAGKQIRAPRWMQRSGLEWVHRVITQPRRLAPRYAADAVHFPRIVFRAWLSRRRAG
jgi:N-acetylglucosaminyldiphosphoundecaprenol N-acetyl-beta-D-mannosaminyltransferase